MNGSVAIFNNNTVSYHLTIMELTKLFILAFLPFLSVSCGGDSDEPDAGPTPDDKVSTAGFDKYTEANIFSRNVKLPVNMPMQGFSLDSDGSVWYTLVSNLKRQEMYVSRGMPNKGTAVSEATTDCMKLTYFGHGTNTAIEEDGNDRYVWAGCYGSANTKGEYWTEKLIGRVKYVKGATVATNECDDYYYIGDFTDMHPSIDAEHDQLTINYGDPDNSLYRCFVVYRLSEAKKAPLNTIEITCTDGFRTGNATSTNKTSVMVRAHDLTSLTPVATPRFMKQGYAATNTYYAWQGYDVNGDRLYYAEGEDNYGIGGNIHTGTSFAYITVFDMKGNVIEKRTQIMAVADKEWTGKMGMSVFGTFESEGVKVRGNKIYLGFGARGITQDDVSYYQNILVYDKPTK